MSHVFKYTLAPGVTDLRVPVYAEPIHVAFQGDNLRIWMCENLGELETRHFRTVATGEDFDGVPRNHIGSAVTDDGLVFHVFEVTA
jgi:hypothetical protein